MTVSGAAAATEAERSGATSDGWSEPVDCADGGTAPVVVIGGATGDEGSARAVSTDCGAAAVTAIDRAARDGASARAVSTDCGAAAGTIIGGATRDGASARAVSTDLGAAAVTVIGGATRGGSERTISVRFGAAAETGADVGGFDVTREGRPEPAGVTNDAPEDRAMVPTEGS